MNTDFTINLDIPEAKTENFEVKKEILEAGSNVVLVSIRESFFSYHSNYKKACSIILEKDLHIYKLIEKDRGTWMTSTPQEVIQMREDAEGIKGIVLVGGLGLGVIVKILNDNQEVKKIVIVEKEKDIVKLVYDSVKSSKTEIIVDDLFRYLKNTKRKFDWAFYDIWAPTGEDILFTHIRPLYKLSKGKIKNIKCWQEKTMLGQMVHSLLDIQCPEEFAPWKTLNDEQFKKSYNFSRTVWSYRNWYRHMKPDVQSAKIAANNYIKNYLDIDKWNKVWKEWDYKENKKKGKLKCQIANQ
jgi:hypothetical protein